MAAYCGAIGSVNVLDFVSTDLFDESQENPFLLKQNRVPEPHPASPHALRSPGKMSVRFMELPLSDGGNSSTTSTTTTMLSPIRQSSPPHSPFKPNWSPPRQPPSPIVCRAPSFVERVLPPAHQPVSPPQSPMAAGSRSSITISLPSSLLNRQHSCDSNASTTLASPEHDMTPNVEETELHKLLYSLSRLGVGVQEMPSSPNGYAGSPPPSPQRQSTVYPVYRPSEHYETPDPTTPVPYSTSSLWLQSPPSSPPPQRSASEGQAGVASLAFRSMMKRESRKSMRRKSSMKNRSSSAPSSPQHATEGFTQDDYYGSQPSSPTSRGSVTFTTMKNLLRGGGALARTVRRDTPQRRRPTCMGTEFTISSRLKRRQKFQRPAVITDAYHRVSAMKLGTSPLKPQIKHIAFPQLWSTDEPASHEVEADPSMPSPKGQLRRDSLITLETLDKIGTRHACPVHLIEETLPDFSEIEPRVDSWNHYRKPKQTLRRPSTWLLGATATTTPRGFDE